MAASMDWYVSPSSASLLPPRASGERPRRRLEGSGRPSQADPSLLLSARRAYGEIRKIQKAARSGGKPIEKPRFPMIILRSPKGWTGPASEHGKQLLNSFASHQVPLPDVKTDSGALKQLEQWLKSYNTDKFLDFSDENLKRGSIFSPLLDLALPKDTERRLGFVKESYNAYKPLDLADWKEFGYEKDKDSVRCVSPARASSSLAVGACRS